MLHPLISLVKNLNIEETTRNTVPSRIFTHLSCVKIVVVVP